MKQAKTVKLALRAIGMNKMRAFLMMLGVIIGITTLTVIVSVGKGASAKVMKTVQNFGADAIMVFAGGGKVLGPPDEKINTLTIEDAQAIMQEIKGIRSMDTALLRVGRTVKYEENNTNTVIYGGTTNYGDAWEWSVESGEYFTEEDMASMARVAVVGKTVVNELYGTTDPIGTNVKIDNINFKVIGVLAPRGTSPMGMDMDSRIVIPYSTASRRVFNTPYVSLIRLAAVDSGQVEKIEGDVASLLKDRHHIQTGFPEDYRVRGASSVSKMAKGMMGTLNLFLGLVSLISLVVGGIVVMNIMLISVGERVNEIGLRRAVGARKIDIRNQFLIESSLITLMGGIIGVIVGLVVSVLLPILSKGKMPAMLSWEPFVLGFIFSVLVGVLAGIHPARKAAEMDPVVTLKG
ncbi:MAG: ABC transporter permease [Nitrospirota bacterium]